MQITQNDTVVLDEVVATGWGTVVPVRGYRNIVVTIATADSTNATIKFAGSPRDTAPTFSSAASPTNQWDYVSAYDMEDPSTLVDGDTGVVYTGTDAVQTYLVNTEGIDHFNVQVSAYSAGTITVTVKLYNY